MIEIITFFKNLFVLFLRRQIPATLSNCQFIEILDISFVINFYIILLKKSRQELASKNII